jgi:YesN/AraC family two-component response regulator
VADQPLSILLVEDDENSSEALCTLLALQFPGALINRALDGKTGLDTFRRQLPDIVISDISMPEMNGADMLKGISSIKADTRVIIITAHTEQLFLEQIAAVCPTVELVPKPINLDILFAAVKRCVALAPEGS